MKIDINKDLLVEYEKDLRTGLSNKEKITVAIAFTATIMFAFLVWKLLHVPIVMCVYLSIPVAIVICAIGFIRFQNMSLLQRCKEMIYVFRTRKLSFENVDRCEKERIFTMKSFENLRKEKK